MNYFDELPFAVTVCNMEGIIIYMNQTSKATFTDAGELIGKSLYDCHNEKSCAKIREILSTGIPNTYTIEKKGRKKLIHQTAWYEEGKMAGIMEVSIVLPDQMDHFKRD